MSFLWSLFIDFFEENSFIWSFFYSFDHSLLFFINFFWDAIAHQHSITSSSIFTTWNAVESANLYTMVVYLADSFKFKQYWWLLFVFSHIAYMKLKISRKLCTWIKKFARQDISWRFFKSDLFYISWPSQVESWPSLMICLIYVKFLTKNFCNCIIWTKVFV